MTLSRDQTLVRQALLGNREAAGSLAEEHLRPAFGIAFALTGSVAESEDVVQEAFLRAFRGLPALRGQDFGPWLAGIVRRVAADLARDRGRAGRARAGLSERARARADSASGPEAAEREEEERLLREELAALPEGLRLPLVLFYFEEQSTARVASHLGLRPAAARKRIQLARDRLRERLLGRFEGAMARLAAPPAALRKCVLAAVAAAPLGVGAGAELAGAGGPGGAVSTFVPAGGGILGAMAGAKQAVALLLLGTAVLAGGAWVAVAARRGAPAIVPEAPAPLAARVSPGLRAAAEPEEQPAAPALADQPPALPDAPLRGRVLEANGDPAAGAVVTANRLQAGRARLDLFAAAVTVEADAAGVFAFAGIEPGTWRLGAASAAGGWGVVERAAAPAAGAIVIRLEPGLPLEGRVIDLRSGEPVEGARVTVWSHDASELRFPPERLLAATGAGGVFRIGLPRGRYTVEAAHRGHWAERRELDAPAGEPAEFRLKRATYVAGRAFLGERGRPLAGGKIALLRNHSNGRGSSGNTITTGADGEFESWSLTSGEYLFTFLHEGCRPVTMRFELTEEEPAEGVELLFTEGIRARGVVRNRDGEALPMAHLNWRRAGAPYAEETGCSADREGRFELPGLEAGEHRVELHGVLNDAERYAAVAVPAGGLDGLELVFDAPAPVIVTVEDAQGRPVSGASVGAECRARRRTGGLGPLLTGDEGRVALSGLSREGSMTLSVTHEELGTASRKLDLAGLEGPIQLRLEPWTELAGEVVDAAGRGVGGALIAVSGGAGGFSDTSDGDGRFRFRMAAGEYDIAVDSPRAGTARLRGVRLPLEDPAQPFRITLGGDGAIRGRVLVPGGEPARDLEVLLRRMPDGDGVHRHARPFVRGSVDAGGWFSVPADDGEYTLQVVAGNFSFGEPVEGVKPGGPPVEVRLASVARRRVTGRVVDGGIPVEGARLWRQAVPDFKPPLMPQDSAEAVTDAAGAFELPLGGADEFVVVAQAPGFVFASSPVLRGGGDGDIDDVVIAPLPGVDLELRVKDAAGKPVAGALVKLTGVTEPRIHASAVAGESGVCIFRRVPPGELRLGAARRSEPRTGKTVLWDFGMEPVEITIEGD